MIANCITAMRIVGAAILLFTETFSPRFYLVYILCGISDAVDGFVARLMKTAGAFGAKLDSIADITFYTISTIKLMPTLWARLPRWFWFIIGAIVLVRIISYVLAAVNTHQMAALHTVWNKCSSFLIFLLPFALLLPQATTPFCLFCALIAAIAAGYELSIHISQFCARRA